MQPTTIQRKDKTTPVSFQVTLQQGKLRGKKVEVLPGPKKKCCHCINIFKLLCDFFKRVTGRLAYWENQDVKKVKQTLALPAVIETNDPKKRETKPTTSAPPADELQCPPLQEDKNLLSAGDIPPLETPEKPTEEPLLPLLPILLSKADEPQSPPLPIDSKTSVEVDQEDKNPPAASEAPVADIDSTEATSDSPPPQTSTPTLKADEPQSPPSPVDVGQEDTNPPANLDVPVVDISTEATSVPPPQLSTPTLKADEPQSPPSPVDVGQEDTNSTAQSEVPVVDISTEVTSVPPPQPSTPTSKADEPKSPPLPVDVGQEDTNPPANLDVPLVDISPQKKSTEAIPVPPPQLLTPPPSPKHSGVSPTSPLPDIVINSAAPSQQLANPPNPVLTGITLDPPPSLPVPVPPPSPALSKVSKLVKKPMTPPQGNFVKGLVSKLEDSFFKKFSLFPPVIPPVLNTPPQSTAPQPTGKQAKGLSTLFHSPTHAKGVMRRPSDLPHFNFDVPEPVEQANAPVSLPQQENDSDLLDVQTEPCQEGDHPLGNKTEDDEHEYIKRLKPRRLFSDDEKSETTTTTTSTTVIPPIPPTLPPLSKSSISTSPIKPPRASSNVARMHQHYALPFALRAMYGFQAASKIHYLLQPATTFSGQTTSTTTESNKQSEGTESDKQSEGTEEQKDL